MLKLYNFLHCFCCKKSQFYKETTMKFTINIFKIFETSVNMKWWNSVSFWIRPTAFYFRVCNWNIVYSPCKQVFLLSLKLKLKENKTKSFFFNFLSKFFFNNWKICFLLHSSAMISGFVDILFNNVKIYKNFRGQWLLFLVYLYFLNLLKSLDCIFLVH